MLHTETVEPRALSILKTLMDVPDLTQFSLVGGTALSLKYGHRKSEDLDLFSADPFNHKKIEEILVSVFGIDLANESRTAKWGIFCYIKEIKVDIIYYPHPVLYNPDVYNGIRLYSDKDIITMKINAILGRGKKKAFGDLAELLQHYSLGQMIDWHKNKFPQQNLLITIPQAITYFEDAEESMEPVSLKKQTWPQVKEIIQQKVREYLT